MAKIAFDIKYRPQIESGEYKVVTKDNKHVRIISWDMHTSSGDKIVALVTGQGGQFEKNRTYLLDGRCCSSQHDSTSLFILTDSVDLTEFEMQYATYRYGSQAVEMFGQEQIEAVRKEWAAILFIARKELQPEIDKELDRAYKNADKVQYERGKEAALKELYSGKEDFKEAVSEKIRNMVSKFFNGDGDVTSKEFADEFAWELLALAKAETYKDLPKWQHMYSGAGGNGEGRNTFLIRDGLGTYRLSPVIVAGDTYLVLHELDKLPK